jgi:hypothetical protein
MMGLCTLLFSFVGRLSCGNKDYFREIEGGMYLFRDYQMSIMDRIKCPTYKAYTPRFW